MSEKSRHTRTAFMLAVVGIAFGAMGFIVASAREILFTLAATGLFGAVLTRFLTPQQLVPIDIAEGIYSTLALNELSFVEQMGLSSTRVYATTESGLRLFVPEVDTYDRSLFSTDEGVDGPYISGETESRSGLVLRPVAEPLLRGFEERQDGTFSSVPEEAALTLSEGLTHSLEFASSVKTDLDTDDGRVTFEVVEFLLGPSTQFDHPVVSFLGAGLATALDVPIDVEVTNPRQGDKERMIVTCQWNPGEIVKTTPQNRDTLSTEE